MKILVTGYTGQLGHDVYQLGKALNFEMIGIGSKDLDITDEESVNDYIEKKKPDAVIHCAAYTAVDEAEVAKDLCWDVNVNGTKYLSTAAKGINAKFMYISTDYVFDGKGERPFNVNDTPHPIGYYGKTKYEGEKVVLNTVEESFVVRISWVFGKKGKNFVKTMLKLAETHQSLNVVADQFGSPTYTSDLARLLIDMIQTDKFGVYHATNEGYCSWSDFAKEIFKLAEENVAVKPVTTEEYPTRAVRPKNSRMNKEKLTENGFVLLPTWQSAVTRFLEELNEEVK